LDTDTKSRIFLLVFGQKQSSESTTPPTSALCLGRMEERGTDVSLFQLCHFQTKETQEKFSQQLIKGVEVG